MFHIIEKHISVGVHAKAAIRWIAKEAPVYIWMYIRLKLSREGSEQTCKDCYEYVNVSTILGPNTS